MARMGRYRLGRVLGRGGAGTVFEATMHSPDGSERPVALKVLRAGSGSLQREARIGGLLRHRNLVDVYEVGEEDGVWFCAMELCLGAVSARLPLPARAVVEIGLQVCEALSYAHRELGLVHLDLKPDNLLLSARGEVKVADLGIARAHGLAADGRSRGTPGYMAPEQRSGGTVDARADVWALGVTLAVLASGALPGASATLSLFTGEQAPEAPEDAPVPEWLWPVVSRCTEAAPEDRFPSMDALAEALRALDPPGPGLAEALGIAPTPPPWVVAATNLPEESDAFVGRTEELRRVADVLDAPGIVTLRGPAGVGKTRLAAVAARRWRERRGAPGWFCDLTSVRSLDGLVFALGRALDVPTREPDAAEKLGRALAGRGDVLVVLDNFEQLTALAQVVQAWRTAAPKTRFLVTSRVRLGVPDETVLDLAPLGPEAARELLVTRAAGRGAGVDDDPDLPELARRLDGLPLALELAAGRLGVLSVRDVLDRLGSGVLRTGADGRHATLQAALDWSWDLLSDAEKRGMAQLSVFSGGWSLEAAEGVVQTGLPAIALLDALVEHSMVRALPGGRYDMLVSIRDHAAERLDDDGATVARHGAWFAARWDESAIRRVEMLGSLERVQVTRDVGNLVAACDRAVARGDGSVAVATLRAAWLVFDPSGPYAEAHALARAVAAMGELDAGAAVHARLILGMAERFVGRTEASLTHFEAAREAARARGDRRAEALAVHDVGLVCTELGRLREACTHYERSLEIYREIGDQRLEGSCLGDLGIVLHQVGELDAARDTLTRALGISREVGDQMTEGLVLANLGVVHLERGELDHAAELLRGAIAVQEVSLAHRSRVASVGNLALVLATQGRLDEARPLLEETLAQHRDMGNRRFEGIVSGNLGILHQLQGRREDARSCIEVARRVAAEIGDRRFEGHWLGWLARLDPEAPGALTHLDRGEALLREVGDPATLAELLAARAEVEATRGNLAAAHAALEQAERAAPPEHSDARAAIARVQARLGRSGT